MTPRIENISDKKMVGMRINLTMAENREKTVQLWRSFGPRKKEIANRLSTDMFSIQIFSNNQVCDDINENTSFEKWAAVEVLDFDQIPSMMETYILAGGLYVVFIHKGTPETFYSTSKYIYNIWLPQSCYEIDNKRAHFDIMGKNYNPNDINSMEEIWIPIKRN